MDLKPEGKVQIKMDFSLDAVNLACLAAAIAPVGRSAARQVLCYLLLYRSEMETLQLSPFSKIIILIVLCLQQWNEFAHTFIT